MLSDCFFCKLTTFRILKEGQFQEKYLVKVTHRYGKKQKQKQNHKSRTRKL